MPRSEDVRKAGVEALTVSGNIASCTTILGMPHLSEFMTRNWSRNRLRAGPTIGQSEADTTAYFGCHERAADGYVLWGILPRVSK